MAFVQGLFWKNLKHSNPRYHKKSCGHLTPLFNQTFLKNKPDFYFIFTGTGNFSLNEIPVVVNHLKNSKESVVDFFLYEPVSYYFKNQGYNLGYYSEFHSYLDCSNELRVAELDSIEKLAVEINKPIRVFHGDYRLEKIVGDHYPDLQLKCLDIFLKNSTRNPYTIHKHDDKKINKKFWCGNGRYTVHRHLIMSYLLNKSGNYSWRFNIDKSFNLDNIDWVNYDLKNLVTQTREELNSKDFNLEFYTKKLNVKGPRACLVPNVTYKSNLEYVKTIRECFCSIVTETRFAQPTGNFSEKTTDAINFGNPFILVAPPRTLEYLKKLEFKTFDQWWDESYDQEENHSERMKKIFKVIDRINSLSLSQLNKMYQEMIPIIIHNKRAFRSFPYHGKITQ